MVTDHKALVAFLHSKILNKRLHGWMLQLLEFDFAIVYRPGDQNQDADALSRQAWDTGEGDPWRPAAETETEEHEEQLRAAATISVVGGDVGTAHIEGQSAQSAQSARTAHIQEGDKEQDKEKEKRTKTFM